MYSYLLLLVAAVTFYMTFSHVCKMLVLINLIEEAQTEGRAPDRHVLSEVDRTFTILCYLFGAAVTIIYFFKILYEKSLI